MNINYTRSELCLRHYLWTIDRRKDNEAHDLDAQVLDILQGNEVLMFANTFLNRYLPGHTIQNLHNLEYALVTHLPNYLVTKRQIAEWLTENDHLFTSDPRLQNLDLEFGF
jgi:hypothetical protein